MVVKQLDLADLSSVRRCAADIAETEDAPQGLILSERLLLSACTRSGAFDEQATAADAGIMIPPLQRTKDGFESQIGCNHLGHFAFAAPILKKMVKQARAADSSALQSLLRSRQLDAGDHAAGQALPGGLRQQRCLLGTGR